MGKQQDFHDSAFLYCSMDLLNKQISSIKDINVLDEYGNTALIWAARNNNKEIVQTLLQKGAKVNLSGYAGLTPLHHAMRHSCHAVIGASRSVHSLKLLFSRLI
jgi:ankyrin repeat protein